MASPRDLAKKVLDSTLDLMLSPAVQSKLAQHILYRARGQSNGDPFTNGEYCLLRSVARACSSGAAVFVDVGANIGSWSLRAAREHPHARVFAFEPHPDVFERLLAETHMTRPAIECHKVALGDRSCTAALNAVGDCGGTHSLYQRFGMASVRSIDVSMATGDDFCRENGIGSIDLLKIDTEGYEMPVLRGFNRMLSEQRIRCVQFEYGGTWIDARQYLADAFHLLSPKGYLLGRVTPAGVVFLRQYSQREDDFVFANYVAATAQFVPAVAAAAG